MPPLARALRLARALLGSQYALMLEYRAEIALWALSGLLPLLMLALWSQAPAGSVPGFGPQQLERYFLAVFVVRQFTIVWVVVAFEEDLLEGRLSPYLLQPLAPVWRYVAAHLAEQATRLPFVAAILLALALVRPSLLWLPSPGSLALALLTTLLAFALRFLLHHAVACLCFWSERAAALDRLLLIPHLFLSGMVAPLEAFPEPLRQLALATPFPWTLALPAELLAGRRPPLGHGLAVMAAWGVLLLLLNRLLWRAGLRRYTAMGA